MRIPRASSNQPRLVLRALAERLGAVVEHEAELLGKQCVINRHLSPLEEAA
jgi:hypothetical protein